MIFERGRGFGQFLRRGFRCELGSTAAEFALLFPPLLWLLFGGLQLALVYTAQGVLDDAAEIASRKISTGQAQTGNLSAAQLKSSLCAPLSSLLNCGRLMVDVHVASSISPTDARCPTLTFDSNGQVTNAWKYEPGEPGQRVRRSPHVPMANCRHSGLEPVQSARRKTAPRVDQCHTDREL